MKLNVIKRELIFGIIVLLFGTGVLRNIHGNIETFNNIIEWKFFKY